MKIACIIHSLNGGGAERVMAGLASRLRLRDHKVTLITLDDGQQDRHAIDKGVRRVALNLMKTSRGWWEKLTNNRRRIQAIGNAVGSERPDVTLSFCDRTNVSTLLATRRTGIPTVISERSDPIKHRLSFWWQQARKRTYPMAARIVALTDTAASHLQPLSKRPVAVIPSAVDCPTSVCDPDVANDYKCVLGVGRLEYEKGFDRLIRAFDIATKDLPKWRLRIVGEGSMREELEQIAQDLGFQDRLEMPGWIKPIWPEYSEASMFALPSRYEGFPSALLEAMATGLPSVSVDCESGPRAIIKHQMNGLLVRNSVDALAAGIRRLITEQDLRESLATEARRIVEDFSWEKMVVAYEELLAEAAGKSNSPH